MWCGSTPPSKDDGMWEVTEKRRHKVGHGDYKEMENACKATYKMNKKIERKNVKEMWYQIRKMREGESKGKEENL